MFAQVKDYTPTVIESIGEEVIIHALMIEPEQAPRRVDLNAAENASHVIDVSNVEVFNVNTAQNLNLTGAIYPASAYEIQIAMDPEPSNGDLLRVRIGAHNPDWSAVDGRLNAGGEQLIEHSA